MFVIILWLLMIEHSQVFGHWWIFDHEVTDFTQDSIQSVSKNVIDST